MTGAGEGEQLAELGATLRSLGHTLDQITLVYPPHTDTLPGFQVSTLLVSIYTDNCANMQINLFIYVASDTNKII